MKKLILCFSCIMAIVLLSGCSMDNTPTKKVEGFLNSYKDHDESVLTQLDDMVKSDSLMNDEQRTAYTSVMKRQYEDLSYEITDEVIDGDTATVTAEIEVYDYYKVNEEAQKYYDENPDQFASDETLSEDNANNGLARDAAEGAREAIDDIGDTVFSDSKYVDYRLDKLKDANDRVTYTIDFTLTKIDDVWTLNEIDDVTRQKIHGLYSY